MRCPWSPWLLSLCIYGKDGAVWYVTHDFDGTLNDTCTSTCIFTVPTDSIDVGIIRGACHMCATPVGEGCTGQPTDQGVCSLESEQCCCMV